MNDLPTVNSNNDGLNKLPPSNDKELEKLRLLLLKQEREQLNFLLNHLNNSNLHANDIAKDLPKAVVLSTNSNNKLKTALTPLIVKIIKTSFKNNAKDFADTLYPVIGPAIRKAVSEALKSLIQSINKTLDYSFSITGIKWRIESIRTGKPFAEIVLAHTLIYQVEQLFLIHRKSGILLQHLVNSATIIQDPDIISGMLNAIQSFVNDSFAEKKNGTLNLMEVGDLTVWIEQSPDIILAAVIRGIAPKELRTIFQNALEDIQVLKSNQLESFSGDISTFDDTKELLKSCLQYKVKQSKRSNKKFKKYWIISFLIITIITIITISSFQKDKTWINFLEKLKNTPGIVVTSSEKSNGKYHISGLRDPLSVNPFDLLKNGKIDSANIEFNFKPYISMEPELILKRIIKLTNPPKSVMFKNNNGTIFSYGSAHHQWITSINNKLGALYFPIQYNDNNLKDIEQEKFKQITRSINNQYISFDRNMTIYPKSTETKLNEIADEIKHLQNLSEILNTKFHIKLIAHSDQTGSFKTNIKINEIRITDVINGLHSLGIEKNIFTKKIIKNKANSFHKNRRCVHFMVISSNR